MCQFCQEAGAAYQVAVASSPFVLAYCILKRQCLINWIQRHKQKSALGSYERQESVDPNTPNYKTSSSSDKAITFHN